MTLIDRKSAMTPAAPVVLSLQNSTPACQPGAEPPSAVVVPKPTIEACVKLIR